MKPSTVIIIAILIHACSSAKPLSVNDVVYSDGINKNEAVALANNYLNNNKNRFCQSVYISGIKEIEKEWKIELACEINNSDLYRPYRSLASFAPSFINAGFIKISRRNGKVSRK